jgi:hypothetical protein
MQTFDLEEPSQAEAFSTGGVAVAQTGGYPQEVPVNRQEAKLDPEAVFRKLIDDAVSEIAKQMKRQTGRDVPVPTTAPQADAPVSPPGERNATVRVAVAVVVTPDSTKPHVNQTTILFGPTVPLAAGTVANVERACLEAVHNSTTRDLDMHMQQIADEIDDNSIGGFQPLHTQKGVEIDTFDMLRHPAQG